MSFHSRSSPASIASGRYRLGPILGVGSRKRVYLARDTHLERDVAIAFLETDDLDTFRRSRLVAEARAMAQLGDHPRIVTIFDVGEEGERPYLVCQHMAGGTLEKRLAEASDHRLPLDELFRIADQVCQALEHAHSRGIVHRDLKPANVWLTDDGFSKLGDFGLAASPDRDRPVEGAALVGTASYVSPEQAIGKPVDGRSDLYSLGAMLYEMATGRPPFVGPDTVSVVAQHLNAPPEPPSRIVPGLPEAFDAFVLALLAKHPGDRPESATAVRLQLRAIAAPADYRALAEHGAASVEEPAGTAFVGRDHELAMLRAALDEAMAGRGRLILVAGEPGIGKTRTVGELAVEARRRGAEVLVGRCHEADGAPAYWPWIEILRSWLRVHGNEAARRHLGERDNDIARLIPEVASGRSPSSASAAESEDERFRLFDGVSAFLHGVARTTPLVIHLEDLHWGDRSSLLLLRFLAGAMRESHLLVVATYRDVEVLHGHPFAEALAALRREPRTERILLRGLPEHDIRTFLATLGGRDLPDAVASAIFRQTEGNPFFAQEILRHLVEERRLGPQGERRENLTSPEDLCIPESVREVIGRRLARLSGECRRVLTVAAVVGREFDSWTLRRIAAVDEEPLLEALDEAMEARIIHPVPRMLGRHAFSHALVRETLRDELRSIQRLRLHRSIGEALEETCRTTTDPPLAELAHHFLEAAAAGAGDDKAIHYAMRAGERAIELFAYEDAVELYERALQVHEATGSDEHRRCDLLLGLGRAEYRRGDASRSQQAFRSAGDLARRLGDSGRFASAALGFCGPWTTIVDPARLTVLEQALAAVGETPTPVRARLLARLALEKASSSAEEAHALGREAATLARAFEDAIAVGWSLAAMAQAHWSIHYLAERSTIAVELENLAATSGDRDLLLWARYFRFVCLLEEGADARSLEREVGEFRQLAIESRRPFFLSLAESGVAALALLAGRFDDAEAAAGHALEVGLPVRLSDARDGFAAQMLVLRKDQGRADEVAREIETMTTSPHPYAIPAWRTAIAFAYAESGRNDEARRGLDALAATGFAALPWNLVWAIQLGMATEICGVLGDRDAATEIYPLLRPHSGRYPALGGIMCFAPVDHSLGVLCRVLGNLDEGDRWFEAAATMELRMQAAPALARTRYEHARLLLARDAGGDREKAARFAQEALDTAHRLGMKRLSERAVTLKLELQGVARSDAASSIDVVATAVGSRRPDLGAVALDGTVTVLFSDMEGFTAMTERLGDRRALEVIREHNAIVRAAVEAHGGEEVELQGDGFLLAFGSARKALRCAVAIQEAFSRRSEDHPDREPIRVRIGVHAGDAIRDEDRFFGRTLILAARIAAEARGGEILVSSLVRQLVGVGDGLEFGAPREKELAGLSGTHEMSPLLWSGAPAPPAVAVVGDRGVFRAEGDFWTIGHRGATYRLKSLRGLALIARLLREPGRELHVLDLVSEERGAAKLEESDAGEMLDAKARAEYRARLDDLRNELAEAEGFNDAGRTERLRAEINALTAELSRAVGLGGRSRTARSNAERARVAVRSAIADAIRKIGALDPGLGHYFSTTIRTGAFCSYVPDTRSPINWEL